MKKIIIFFFSIILALNSFAQSGNGTSDDPYYGTISGSVEWDPDDYSNGEVYVGSTAPNEDLTIIDDGHLTILPGVKVIFMQPGSDLIITGSGILTAEGTTSDTIIFTKASGNDNWGHISFEIPGSGTPIEGTGSFSYCIMEYGYAATSGTNPDNAGGGIQVNADDVTITNCLFENNYSNFGGGVTVNAGRNTVIKNSLFNTNTSNQAGGALLLWTNSTAKVENCIFEENNALGDGSDKYGGGAIWLLNNTSTIVNCTFVNNTATDPGDAIYSYGSSGSRIVNSILWGSDSQFAGSTTTSTIQTCAFEGAKPSNALNSIIISDVANDHFTDAGSGDWSLKFISPCRDAGLDSYPGVTIPTLDYAGNNRVFATDIGAYEVQYSRWTGGSNDKTWTSSGNWDGGVPTTSSSDVIIPTGLALNYPIIATSPPDFEIGSGKIMILEPEAKATFGTLTNNGLLKLQADADSTASLILNSYSGSGTEEIQLYLTGGGSISTYKWHYISTPVSSLPVSTFTGVTLNIVGFNEPRVTTDLLQGWVAFDGYVYTTPPSFDYTYVFSTLNPGKGYDYFHDSNYEFTFSGSLITANQPMLLSYSGTAHSGFNLLGNPFSSGLDWNTIINTNYPSSTSKGLYFTRNNAQCSYVGGVGIPGDVTGIIPPMQGFFVKTSAIDQTINLTPSARTHANIHARYKGAYIIPLVRLSLLEDTITDETVVRFDESAKSYFDNDFDALKIFDSPENLAIYSYSDGTKYAINGLPFPDTLVEIPIIVNLVKEGNHTITSTQLQGLDNYKVHLIDNTTGFTANLKTTPTVTFSASAGLLSDRFILKIINITTGTEDPVYTKNNFNIYQGYGLINIQTLADDWDGSSGTVKVLDMAGKTVSYLQNAEFIKNSVIQVQSPAANGFYFIEIRSGVKRYVGKVVIK